MTLEVDRSLIDRSLKIVQDESPDNVITWLQNDRPKNIPKHKKIQPYPGICIKIWSESKEKVFINLCHSKDIVPPEDVSDEKFHALITEDEPAFVIPMALGKEKMAKDKDDVERSTFDILINTKYYEKCMQKDYFLEFTIAAIVESINDKYKKSLELSKYVILTNKKVMGSLDIFTIEDREPRKPVIKKPLIQVLDIPDESKNKPKSPDSNPKYDPKLNNFVIMKPNGHDHLIGFFYLPSSNIEDVTVDIGENRVIVENQKTNIMIDALLPNSIDNSHVIANFDSKLQILRLVLPLKN